MATFGADLKLMTFDPKKSVDYRQTKKNPLEKRLILLTAMLLPRYLYCRRFFFGGGSSRWLVNDVGPLIGVGATSKQKGIKLFNFVSLRRREEGVGEVWCYRCRQSPITLTQYNVFKLRKCLGDQLQSKIKFDGNGVLTCFSAAFAVPSSSN